tara:strand:+ start:741 stop:1073 length:333 start_codon:yes stop_codon:yes gene_type:complete
VIKSNLLYRVDFPESNVKNQRDLLCDHHVRLIKGVSHARGADGDIGCAITYGTLHDSLSKYLSRYSGCSVLSSSISVSISFVLLQYPCTEYPTKKLIIQKVTITDILVLS